MDNTLESIRDHVLAERLLNDNKLIAEFMEYELQEELWVATMSKEDDTFLGRHLLFHNSWDWLMPVVDKIESIHGVFRRGSMTKGGQLHNATEKKYVIEYGMHDKVIAYVYANSRIDAEYQAVVEFIKDHNLKQDKPLKLSGEMIEVPIEKIDSDE